MTKTLSKSTKSRIVNTLNEKDTERNRLLATVESKWSDVKDTNEKKTKKTALYQKLSASFPRAARSEEAIAHLVDYVSELRSDAKHADTDSKRLLDENKALSNALESLRSMYAKLRTKVSASSSLLTDIYIGLADTEAVRKQKSGWHCVIEKMSKAGSTYDLSEISLHYIPYSLKPVHSFSAVKKNKEGWTWSRSNNRAPTFKSVSYTHLTLPTICSV